MTTKIKKCPKCKSNSIVRSGIIKAQQRYKCKACSYHFTVEKEGKSIESYYVIKALQLYIEGVSTREIERLLGVSHVSVLNWVKKYKMDIPTNNIDKPTYQVYTKQEIADLITNQEFLKNSGVIINELGDKFMVIKWIRRS